MKKKIEYIYIYIYTGRIINYIPTLKKVEYDYLYI
jgi:hypothetical protein